MPNRRTYVVLLKKSASKSEVAKFERDVFSFGGSIEDKIDKIRGYVIQLPYSRLSRIAENHAIKSIEEEEGFD